MLPLGGRRVVVTRPRGSASKLTGLLEEKGAEVVEIPTLELLPPASFCALDAALAAMPSFDWLLLTSANTVEALMSRARMLRLQPRPRRIAAVGSATARAALESGLAEKVDLMPARFVAEALLEALLPHAPGARMLLPRAAVARDLLPDGLRAGGAEVTVVEAYRTGLPPSAASAIREAFRQREIDAVTLSSGSAAGNLHALVQEAGVRLPPATVLASIGPVTSAAMRELGWEPTVEAEEATLPALVHALVGALNPMR